MNIFGVGKTHFALRHPEWPAAKRTGRIALCLVIANGPYEEHHRWQSFHPQMGGNPPPGAGQTGETRTAGVFLGHDIQIPHQGDCEEVAWSEW